jgi:hypothetical protein
VGPDWFNATLPAAQDALPDGPPCLQHLMEAGFPPGTWDTGTFNLGVYCQKAFPDSWQQQLIQLNAINFPPDKWPASDLVKKIKSLEKKDYQYQCSKHPLVAHCNPTLCRTRKYGVSGSNSTPFITGLTRLMTDPPVWSAEVDGVRISMSSEEFINPILFQLRCFKAGVVVNLVKRTVWTDFLKPLVAAATEIEVGDDGSDVDDCSAAGVFLELLESFCMDRIQGASADELAVGRPYTADGMTWFRLTDLMTFMARRGVKNYSRRDAVMTLKAHGAKNRLQRIAGRPTRVWSIKEFVRAGVTLGVPATVPDQGHSDTRYGFRAV